jgi:hypothetical protein
LAPSRLNAAFIRYRRLWLFKYRYEPQEDDPPREGIGLAGSTTFSLFPQTKVDLSPEDVYGLHCCWELEIQEDDRAPKKGSAMIGRKILVHPSGIEGLIILARGPRYSARGFPA